MLWQPAFQRPRDLHRGSSKLGLHQIWIFGWANGPPSLGATRWLSTIIALRFRDHAGVEWIAQQLKLCEWTHVPNRLVQNRKRRKSVSSYD